MTLVMITAPQTLSWLLLLLLLLLLRTGPAGPAAAGPTILQTGILMFITTFANVKSTKTQVAKCTHCGNFVRRKKL